MKYLVIILLLAGGYWFYTEKYVKEESSGENLAAQLQEGRPVSIHQAKTKANEIVTFLCNDADFQAQGQSSPAECMGKYAERKDRCEERVFPEGAQPITTEEELKAHSKRFINCVMDA